MSSARRRIAGVTGLALAATGLSGYLTPAHANTDGTSLVISEVYGGGGNSGATWKNDFIELYNPTDAAISVDGMSVQGRSATNTSAASGANLTALTGSVPAQGYYLVQEAAGTGGTAALPTADATGSMAMGAGGWQIWLATTTTGLNPAAGDVSDSEIVDFVGGAPSATSFETAPVSTAPSATVSIQRDASGTDTDDNSADFTTATPTPTNTAGETESNDLAVTAPGNKTAAVGTAITSFTLAATGGTTPYTWSATGLPDGLSVSTDGVVSGTPTTAGTSSVTATVTDAESATASTTFSYTVTAPATEESIADIQGDGDTSPLVGSSVITTGVVTADYTTGGYNGFYLQDPSGDPDDDSSDAVFVYGSATAAAVTVGESVQVTGTVSEYNGLTEVSTSAAGDVTELDTPLGEVTPLAVPWTDLATDAEKEAHEGELLDLSGDEFTVSDNYDANYYGSFTLASGDHALRTPTEYADASDTDAIQAIEDDNAARMLTLDDGASVNFNSTANKGTALPWLSTDNPVRIGSTATFNEPVVLDYRNSLWNVQPTAQVTDDGTDVVSFSDTRADNESPQDVGGDIRLATFNVLNYFPTTGEEYVSSGLGTCTYYDDRAGNHITDNTCTGTNGSDPGPRGAATTESLARQQAKIVKAINGLGASIVSLEELENSSWFGKDRDYAIGVLVDALNTAAGSDVWAYAPSPAAADLPAQDEQDVIRTGFIYKPADVELVGSSHVLADQSGSGEAFENAREPLAQAFKAVGASDDDAFLVIVNHFKSKGSGDDDGTGQGNSNLDRVKQANALVDFASGLEDSLGTDKVFFTGDFNAYSKEDPVEVIEDAGYTELNGEFNDGEATYSYDGMDGSLDHVFANAAAEAWVTGVDVWQINAQEQVGFEYSRYNYNATLLYDDSQFRASDHNPEIVGLDLPDVTSEPAAVTLSAGAVKATYGKKSTVKVTLTTDDTPTGTVTLSEGSKKIGSAKVSAGVATLTIGATELKPGTHKLTATYSGDTSHEVATTTVKVVVARANAKISATVKPARIVVAKTQAKVRVKVSATGVTPTGRVKVTTNGKTKTATLTAGKATIKLAKFTKTGKQKVKISYVTSPTVKSTSSTITIKVVRK
ncbi:MAG: ExeM/NucH family extracellular endonuclease [Nocardioides sp.]|uniref:ExeM/NucH family extracellular endonuclease n=1 Tax=Nocardioides sp. TaxID=35761 RepID=UPI0039E45E64